MCPVDSSRLACVARGGRFWSHSGTPMTRKPAPEALPTLGPKIVFCTAVVFDSLLSTDTETLCLRKGSYSGLPKANEDFFNEFGHFRLLKKQLPPQARGARCRWWHVGKVLGKVQSGKWHMHVYVCICVNV